MWAASWPWAKQVHASDKENSDNEQHDAAARKPRKSKVLRLQQQYRPSFSLCKAPQAPSSQQFTHTSLSLQHIRAALAESGTALQLYRDRFEHVQLRLQQVTAERDARPLPQDMAVLRANLQAAEAALTAAEQQCSALHNQLVDERKASSILNDQLKVVNSSNDQLQKSLASAQKRCHQAELRETERDDEILAVRRRAEAAESELSRIQDILEKLQQDVKLAQEKSAVQPEELVKPQCQECEHRHKEALELREQVVGALQASKGLQIEVTSLHQLMQQQSERIRSRDRQIDELQRRLHEAEVGHSHLSQCGKAVQEVPPTN